MTTDLITIPSNIPHEQKIEWVTDNLDKFCILPWLNLNTNPNGNIKLCCSIQLDTFVSDKEEAPFNLGYNDIEEIWNSNYMRFVRESKRFNRGASDCVDCYKMEKLSGHSPRQGQNAMWIDKKARDFKLNRLLGDVVTPFYIADQYLDQLPTSLELRLGNQCNLQCISCWGMSSSLIHTERANYLDNGLVDAPALAWLKPQWKQERLLVENTDVTNWFETDMFYSNFKKMAPNLRRLYTTGGEPTLIKSNYKMLEMMLDADNNTCSIEFTSNMTTWNPSFYSKLEKFKNVEIQMSIDGVDDIGEYIRYPSNFSKVRENVERAIEMASTRPGWKIKCYTVLQALNYNHLVPIWDMLHEFANKYDQRIDWWPITLSNPEFLSLASVKSEIRDAYVPELVAAAANEKYSDGAAPFTVNAATLAACRDSIVNTHYKPEMNERLKAYITFNDAQRSVNGAELFKDIL